MIGIKDLKQTIIREKDFLRENEMLMVNNSLDKDTLLNRFHEINDRYKVVIESLQSMIQIKEYLDQQNDYLKKRNEALMAMCVFDALTKIYTRRYILQLLECEIEKNAVADKGIAVVMVDIDDFKGVNELFGHQCGDNVLKKVATTIDSLIRPGDALGRYGGEEFLLVLPNTTKEEGFAVVERLRKGIENIKLTCLGENRKVTASFGLCHTKSSKEIRSDQIIFHADMALSKAKKTGKNRTVTIAML